MTSDDRHMADQPRPDEPHTDPSDAELLAMARRGHAVLGDTDRTHVASLWDGIAAAAFDDHDTSARPDDHGTGAVDTLVPPTSASTGADPVPNGPDRTDATLSEDAEVVDLATARRRRRSGWVAALAAAAVLVVAVAGSILVTSDPSPDTVATFALDALDDRAQEVDGTIVTDGGQTRIEVDLASLPAAPDDSFYELWLLDADAGRLVSLGPVEDQGSFVVPAAVEVGDWPLLDVSVEPVDGDPTHSSDSVLRGEIVAAGPTDS
ncbi:anti-sigma factor [Salsipaludibacter albus]|uniref:anti-sigma factor n=1 Tax=Salsipaludibacter albus TaxID=2849650 RepID=UPI001EE3D840|nr:anti-sigma factor [Salsipaludibacter albus]MBY5164429.1 anti-sigma factor [Salsipaludibacter albus]